jgi:hypothetical protein
LAPLAEARSVEAGPPPFFADADRARSLVRRARFGLALDWDVFREFVDD